MKLYQPQNTGSVSECNFSSNGGVASELLLIIDPHSQTQSGKPTALLIEVAYPNGIRWDSKGKACCSTSHTQIVERRWNKIVNTSLLSNKTWIIYSCLLLQLFENASIFPFAIFINNIKMYRHKFSSLKRLYLIMSIEMDFDLNI